MRKDWEVKKLGDVCEIERGGSPRPISSYITNDIDGINWIKIGDASDGSKYISSTKEKIKPEGVRKSRMVYKGDFILSNSMSFGKPYILDIDGCIHDGWLVIRDINNLFEKSFLYYYLSSPKIYREFKKMAVGGVVSNLNTSLVKGLYILIPPFQIQQQIVEELDCLTSIIEKQKKQLEELDNLAQSIFYDMFGDPIENNKGWKVKTFKEICNSDLGKTLNKSKDVGVLHPYLCSINIQWNKVDLSLLKEACFEENEILKYVVYKGDLLVCEGGDIGRAAIWQEDYPMLYQNALHRIRFKDNVIAIYGLYFLWALKKKGILDTRYAKGVTIKHLVKAALLSIKISVPPLPLQQQFAAKIEAIEKQKELIKKSIKETEDLFNSRMDYYFN